MNSRAKITWLIISAWFGLYPALVLAQAVDPLPPKPLNPVVPSTPPTPPSLPTVPTTPPGQNSADANNLLSALKDLSAAGSEAGAATDAIMAKLSGVNVQNGIDGLKGFLPNGTGNGPNLSDFGAVLGAAQNGSLWTAMNGVYDELGKRLALPLAPEDKNLILSQMQQLQSLMSGQNALNAGLGMAKSNVTNYLNAAGLGTMVGALDDLIKGNGDPEDIAKRLLGVNPNTLNNALNQLGAAGLEGLAQFLPPGTDPSILGQVMDAIKTGNMSALLDNLKNQLKEKLKSALPQDVAALTDLIGKLDTWKNDPVGLAGQLGNTLGGLLGWGGSSVGSTPDCKMNKMNVLLSRITDSKGDTNKNPTIRICQ